MRENAWQKVLGKWTVDANNVISIRRQRGLYNTEGVRQQERKNAYNYMSAIEFLSQFMEHRRRLSMLRRFTFSSADLFFKNSYQTWCKRQRN